MLSEEATITKRFWYLPPWDHVSGLPKWPLGPLPFRGAVARTSSALQLTGSPVENFLFFFGVLLLPASLANRGGPVLGVGAAGLQELEVAGLPHTGEHAVQIRGAGGPGFLQVLGDTFGCGCVGTSHLGNVTLWKTLRPPTAHFILMPVPHVGTRWGLDLHLRPSLSAPPGCNQPVSSPSSFLHILSRGHISGH